jgi:G:T-mismatch repair DNA endonuclease (very short patch repair protein)
MYRMFYFLSVLKSHKHNFRLYRNTKSFLRKSKRERKRSPIAVTMYHHHKRQLFLPHALFWYKINCSSALNPLTTTKRSYQKISCLCERNDKAARLINFCNKGKVLLRTLHLLTCYLLLCNKLNVT